REIFQCVFSGNGRSEFESEVVRKDGAPATLSINAAALRDDQGRIVGATGYASDVTEKKKLEAQFLRAQRMESIGTLAGGIAHDLNNVFTPIMMAVDIMRSKTQDSGSSEMLQVMETSTKRGADLVRQVLYFARGLQGDRRVVQPAPLIKEMHSMAGDTFPKSIRLHL